MAYGRLDVFWPDGHEKRFTLEDSSVSVGRSPGNTIPLDTDSISRYHFSITYQEGEVVLTDLGSANGTVIDGVRLAEGAPRLLRGGEEITIGTLRMRFERSDELPTQPTEAVDDTTMRIEVSQPTFRVDVQPPPIAVPPGAYTSAEVSITNTGDEAGEYRVEVTGAPAHWVRVDRPRVALAAGEQQTVSVTLKPTRTPESAPGNYALVVSVRPLAAPDLRVDAPITLRVLPYSGFGAALERARVVGTERVRLHVHNQGSGPLPLRVQVRGYDALEGRIVGNHALTLGPGQRAVVQADLVPRSRYVVGRVRRVPFDVVLHSGDAAGFTTALRGTHVQQALLPTWVPYAVGSALLLLLLLLGGTLLLATQPRPLLNSVAVEPTRVARGTPVQVLWQAQDVQAVEVRVNGAPVLTNLDPASGNATLDTATWPDAAVVAVVGRTRNGQELVREQRVSTYAAMQVAAFNATPAQLVRYTASSLTLSWQVSQAVSVRLDGLQGFSGAPANATFGASGTLANLVGIPSAPLIVDLVARDADGNTLSETLTVPLVDPTCRAADQPVPLRRTAAATGQVIATVPLNVVVVVDGQDLTGTWLRAQLPGGAQGWGERAAFACSGFDVAALQEITNVPLGGPNATTAPPSPLRPTPTVPPVAILPPLPLPATITPRP